MKILVTGSTGFVGKVLTYDLVKKGFHVVAVVRKKKSLSRSITQVVVPDINENTSWVKALENCNAVIHLAGRVHVMQETSSNPLAEFRRLNVAGSKNLARCAIAAGVKRFVYVSSIKVNGEETLNGEAFTEFSKVEPQDPYGVSKYEAEQALLQVARETGLEVVIVRTPIVYGTGVKGNFAQLISVLKRGLPLPFASVCNKRSLLYVGNLVDALLLCATHPAAGGQTYLVSDGEDLSTFDLLHKLTIMMGRAPRIFAFPTSLLKLAGLLMGKSKQIGRLLGSLQVDSSKIRRELGWVPPYTLEQGLQNTVQKVN